MMRLVHLGLSYVFRIDLQRLCQCPGSFFELGSGGGWIALGLVVMDR